MNKDNLIRLYTEKIEPYNVEGINLLKDFKENLEINELSKIRVINWYDICGENLVDMELLNKNVFTDPAVDTLYEDKAMNFYETLNIDPKALGTTVFATTFLKGQYDKRADFAGQCLKLLKPLEDYSVKCYKIYILSGNLSEEDILKIKKYIINPVDSREVKVNSLDNLINHTMDESEEPSLEIEDFLSVDAKRAEELKEFYGLAMSSADILFLSSYFNKEKRNPTLTELKVIDTYWSDHCRHTTFNTEITKVSIEPSDALLNNSFNEYVKLREDIYGENSKRPITLMDVAVLGLKVVRKRGYLKDLDESKEINACSIIRDVTVDGVKIPYSIQFKNETHNHPTEIEPYGGAATCLGGAIRDPLSGRAYVYQALRVTGSSDPREKVSDTMEGKLPARKICLEASAGYSSYGNQIGLCTGLVDELYHEGYRAKRMEVGAVIGSAPLDHIKRLEPEPSDLVLLLGGKTGKDGVGGATGSSKIHDENSMEKCNAEVQKGDAVTERKIQRLFRKGEATRLIKRCNDFGAGGVCVAAFELADGVKINLNKVPLKYSGLTKTEIAISESQERMALVIAPKDLEEFMKYAKEENIECTVIGEITEDPRLVMEYMGEKILDLSREFINSSGAPAFSEASIKKTSPEKFFNKEIKESFKEQLKSELSDINVCSKKGLTERFDSSIGGSSVLVPYGGKYQETPIACAVSKIPVLGDTTSVSYMAYGFNPYLSDMSPYHGAIYAVLTSLCNIASVGGDYKTSRLSFQEFFEKPNLEAEKFGAPLASLLGTLWVQDKLNIPAIGGKDSMSGTFKDIKVPSTLISFAFNTGSLEEVISPELKAAGSNLFLLPLKMDENYMPCLPQFEGNMELLHKLILENKVKSAFGTSFESIMVALSKMSFGNRIGIDINNNLKKEELFKVMPGSVIIEVSKEYSKEELFGASEVILLGETSGEKSISFKGENLDIKELNKIWNSPLAKVYVKEYEGAEVKLEKAKEIEEINNLCKDLKCSKPRILNKEFINFGKPSVLIPVFPGSNCEYDLTKAFTDAGARVKTLVFKNATGNDVLESIKELSDSIKECNILSIPGGFSASDEPDGSGKFIANVLRNKSISSDIMNLLKNKDGLILGICNGFQALVKVGLLPYGEIREDLKGTMTLSYNSQGHHVATVSRIKVMNNTSPWLLGMDKQKVYGNAISHGEGRFIGSFDGIENLFKDGQVATVYVDENGTIASGYPFNPNGSLYAIEGLLSKDGRILGKMGHVERYQNGTFKNIPLEMDMGIISKGVEYFK